MGMIYVCDLCREPIDPDAEHYRVQLTHWSDPTGEPPAPVAPATTEIAGLLVHKEHVEGDPEEWITTALRAERSAT